MEDMGDYHYVWIKPEKSSDPKIFECNTIGQAPYQGCPWDVCKDSGTKCKGKGYIGGPIFKGNFTEVTACRAREMRWILGYTTIEGTFGKDFLTLHTGDINFPDMRTQHFLRIKDVREAIGCTCDKETTE